MPPSGALYCIICYNTPENSYYKKYCRVLQRADGYGYPQQFTPAGAFLFLPQPEGIRVPRKDIYGSFGSDNSIQFTVTDCRGTTIKFSGTVNIDGSLSGSYSASSGGMGTWRMTQQT